MRLFVSSPSQHCMRSLGHHANQDTTVAITYFFTSQIRHPVSFNILIITPNQFLNYVLNTINLAGVDEAVICMKNLRAACQVSELGAKVRRVYPVDLFSILRSEDRRKHDRQTFKTSLLSSYRDNYYLISPLMTGV